MEPVVAPPSFWLATCGDDLSPRPPLGTDVQVDVCIVGAGYTGLWTAYHLSRLDPSLRVVVVEKEIAGWGASGRNGGWCSALFAASWERVSREHGVDSALRLRRALEQVVLDVGSWSARHDVDIHYARGGTLTFARDGAQLQRLRTHVEHDRRFGGDDTVLLDAPAATERVGVAGALAAAFNPHCAAIQPARLARGLARVVEQQGVTIYERSPVMAITPGRVRATVGTVRADIVVRATEGYTTNLDGEKRSLAPVWSLLVATEPLPQQVWAKLGWRGRETVADERHVIIYAQRTADDRIAFGGRGAPYLFASGTEAVRGHARAHTLLEEALREMFPATRDAAVTHRWSGVLGVPRDWMPSVGFDRASGLAWAGGYVGDGVGCAALAGQTLADLVLGRGTDLTTLPWVGHRSPAWEPEPLRWAGIRGVSAALALADRRESRSGRPSRVASAVQRLMGD